MARVEYHHDPSAPKANNLVPAASAIVVDDQGRLLLHRRSDNDLWSIPGGGMEIGESIASTIAREVEEETGILVEPIAIVGVYSDPGHVVAYDDGEVRQQFSVCLTCRILGGDLSTSDESLEVRLVAPEDIPSLPMAESIRQRINDYLRGGPPVIA
ncbi:MAG TPA: NUDIX domain-containing protein [Mycobacteriales bacterium]|nr:NUDIX domain-containing protein [Mycobacteriales bacterium]